MSKNYRVNLPQTEFPMRAGLPQQEPAWIARWQQEDLYQNLMNRPAEKGDYVLHCGPPYANGRLHLGHALSYVLKDFVVRSKSMAGFRTPFVPGWDCHGLPIEWKIEQDLRAEGKSKDDLTTKQLRDLCRAYAKKWVDVQRADWKRFGVIADLDNPYLTMDSKNEAGIVRVLGMLADRGLLYKGVKSVHWSTVEQTALAEAEIEYKDKQSTAVHVKFPIVGKENEYVVIWTTTPWTLPANRAVAYGEEIDYVAIKDGADTLWVAAALVDAFAKALGRDLAQGQTVKGSAFAGWKAVHPLYQNRIVPMLAGHHVTTDAGTGFVHTAPAHGYDDFLIGKANDLILDCPVAGDGRYEDFVDADAAAGELQLAGKDIWKTQAEIVERLRNKGLLLKDDTITHSYPVSWRSKAPLIFRTTAQWFLAVDGNPNVREESLKAVKDVQWVPAYGENRITAMLEGRPDWCISRQRVWGVPITIFVDKANGKPLLDGKAFEAIAKQIEKHGIDAWDELSTAELLAGYTYEGDINNLVKETDILDVWFDSGTTWEHVLNSRDDLRNAPADMYLEGSDQHRGWFQTSLLSSVAATGKAPFKTVLTHGFVVDGEGRKMSKSLGNGVEPQELMDKYGADIMRLWIAASDYSEDVRLSDQILSTVTDGYRQLRNTFRYLLGNLADFDDGKNAVPYGNLPALEKWVLARLSQELKTARTAYDNFKFHEVYQALRNFCATDLNVYFDVRKDALYCEAKNSELRRSVQTVLSALLKAIATHMAPLLPFTCDEVWRYRFGQASPSVHLHTFFEAEEVWASVNPQSDAWQHLFDLRDKVNLAIESKRATLAQNGVKIPNAVHARVGANQKVLGELGYSLLADLCKAAEVIFTPAEGEIDIGLTKYAACPRCWRHVADVGHNSAHPELCGRCAAAEDQAADEAAA